VRVAGWILSLLLVPAVAFPMPPRKMTPGNPELPEYRGGSGGLPVGCHYTSQELVRAALEMRAVRRAIWEFESKGYIAVPGGNSGHNGCPRGVPASAVVLPYRHPSASSYVNGDSAKYAAPMVVVLTAISPSTGEPSTAVSGGTVVVDGRDRRIYVDESIGPAFDVVLRGTGGKNRVPADQVAGEGASPPEYEIDDWSGFVKGITKWAGCTGAGAWGCAAGAALRPGGILLYSNPETAAGVIGGCMVGAGIGCAIGQLLD
jgi:hypothetical protein